jgi:sulfite exporter TauE/SafE
MATSLLVSALLAGLVGGLHCAAMCGGFIAAISARDSAGVRPLLPANAVLGSGLQYHAGRLMSYAALGSAFGAAGAATIGAVDLLPIQQALYVVANALLLALAISIATRRIAGVWLARTGMSAFARVLPWASPLTQGSRPAGRLALGALWGFVPCGLVYGVLPLALFAGGAWQGAAVMLAFGVGSLPHLVGFGWLLQEVRYVLRGNVARHLAAAVLAGFALFGMYRTLYLPETLAQGPFCFVP